MILNGDIHLAIERDGSGGLFIRFTGAPDVTYRLQLTPSLQPPAWTDTGPARPGTGGVLTFTDPGAATNTPSHFYRARLQ